jgi:hypothetical protein
MVSLIPVEKDLQKYRNIKFGKSNNRRRSDAEVRNRISAALSVKYFAAVVSGSRFKRIISMLRFLNIIFKGLPSSAMGSLSFIRKIYRTKQGCQMVCFQTKKPQFG